MTINDARIIHFALPMRRPIVMMGREISERHGAILSIKDNVGNHGLGEISPFPGLSRESLQQALQQLKAFVPILSNTPGIDFESIKTLTSDLFPSVRFGVESALIHLQANKNRTSIGGLLASDPLGTINVNALVTGEQNLVQEIEDIRQKKYKAVKIKVGRDKIEQEIKFVRSVRQKLGPEIAVRLDANRAWNLDNALLFAHSVKDCGIEYIEEPLKEASFLETFFDETGMPIALDESLTLVSAANPPRGTHAFIIKPGVHGGVFDVMELIKAAACQNIEPVLSSPFLSAVGVMTALNIAAAFTRSSSVMGLGLEDFFLHDMLTKTIGVSAGAITIREFNDAVALNSSLFIEAGDEL